MAEQLTAQQKMAVVNRGGKLLVSAAAGSGKTKVLVDRLMSYLTDPAVPADIDDFLIITYTKAAAAELRGKIAAKLAERIAEDPGNRHLQRQMQRLYLAKISTVHSFCSDLLKEFAYMLDVSADFRMAEESETLELQQLAVEQVLDESYSSGDPAFYAFVDSQGLGRSDYKIPEIIFDVYEKSRCHLNPEKWLSDCLNAGKTDGLTDAGQTVWGRYLIEELHSYLDMQIAAMTNCANLAGTESGIEKATALLWENVDALCNLRNCNSWDAIVSNKDFSYGTLSFGKKCDNEALKAQIKAVRDACKKGVAKRLEKFANMSEQVLADLEAANAAMHGLVAAVERFSNTYDSLKRSRRILDFSDLEHKTLDLLTGKTREHPTKLATEIGSRFREVMVDEYQDSNAVQDKIFSALTEHRQNCFMVGDVKQSIYQFRLADPEIFLDKYKTYATADTAKDQEGRKVLLSKNFRSSQGVISAVNDVFSACMTESVGGLDYGSDEALYEGIPHTPLNDPEVELYAIDVAHDTYYEEATIVAERIVDLLKGKQQVRDKDQLRRIRPDDIVILLRSPGSVGYVFQTALEQRGIRCTMGSSNDMMQAEEIVVFRAILQSIHNPLQDIPLVSTLTSRVIGFTADDLAALRIGKRKGSIYSALLKSDDYKAKSFLALLNKLRYAARNDTLTQLLNRVLLETKLDSTYGAMENGKRKVENIYTFCQLAANFESNSQGQLGRFLDYLTTLEESGYAIAEEGTTDTVRIMSIHKSKGLEFPVVFLSGLSKVFNKEDVKAEVLCDRKLGMGLCCADQKNRIKYPTVSKKAISEKKIRDAISEEMRVLYVAMTRAKDRLIMTYAQQNLDSKIAELAQRIELSPRELLVSDVNSAGDWVLFAALQRTESRALLSDDWVNDPLPVTGEPWMIRRTDVPEERQEITADQMKQEMALSSETLGRIRDSLAFCYPYKEATITPSKQTATQMKGRTKDFEVAENTQKRRDFSFRKPSFVEESVDKTGIGSLVHLVMQQIRYASCVDLDAVKNEIDRLVHDGFINEQEKRFVDADAIYKFFTTSMGKRMADAPEILREFKFSILDDGSSYGEGLEGESVLLQGVVDCALMEDDGITVIDFKTDYVTESTVDAVIDRYRTQVEVYAKAMERIYQKPVKASLIYFFRLGEFYQV